MTVLEVIQRSSEFLGRKGVDAPRLQVELLLAHVLQMPRMKLYLNFDRILAAPELETLRALVKRRGAREPLQQLVGSTSFCGLEMGVTRDVLIPRPETELLAEQAIEFVRAAGAASPASVPSAPSPGNRPRRVLDFGTGSGCLAIVIAARCSEVVVHAVDRSEAALAVARANAARHGVEGRVHFQRGDGLAALGSAAAGAKFDLLVSNPPYIPTGEIDSLQPEVRDFEPREALDGGEDGLEFFRMLATGAAGWLGAGAPMMLEVGAGQAEAVSRLLSGAGWRVNPALQDYGGHGRILIARRLD